MATINVVIVDPGGTAREAEIKNDLGAFQAIVGGYIEPIFGRLGTIYVNEEGMFHSLPINRRVTEFAAERLGRTARYPLVGTALIVGPADTQGNDTDVRPAVVDYFTKEK